jgi:hypothetical protein
MLVEPWHNNVAIAKVFPQIICSLLDLEQVIRNTPSWGVVKYSIDDMFEFTQCVDDVLLNVIFQ